MKDTTLNPDDLLRTMRYDAHFLNRDWGIGRWTPRDAHEVVSRAVTFAARFQRLDELCREGRLPDAWETGRETGQAISWTESDTSQAEARSCRGLTAKQIEHARCVLSERDLWPDDARAVLVSHEALRSRAEKAEAEAERLRKTIEQATRALARMEALRTGGTDGEP